MLRIDPRQFTGHLAGSFGPDLYHRETTSQLARAGAATAAVNSGFFVLDPSAGAPGDPAGAGVYDGKVLSEAVNGRPTLMLHDNAQQARSSGSPGAGPPRSTARPPRSTPSTGYPA